MLEIRQIMYQKKIKERDAILKIAVEDIGFFEASTARQFRIKGENGVLI